MTDLAKTMDGLVTYIFNRRRKGQTDLIEESLDGLVIGPLQMLIISYHVTEPDPFDQIPNGFIRITKPGVVQFPPTRHTIGARVMIFNDTHGRITVSNVGTSEKEEMILRPGDCMPATAFRDKWILGC